MNHTFIQIVLLPLVFALGWYTHAWWMDANDKKEVKTSSVEELSLPEKQENIETKMDYPLVEGSLPIETLLNPASTVKIDNLSAQSQFVKLLQLKLYEEAIELYNETVSADENHAAKLKINLLSHLNQLLETRKHEDFVNLADIYLSDHYADIDVLILLAEFNRISGYLTEAITVFQLAFTYAYENAEKHEVIKHFDKFIRTTDRYLSEQNLWLDLQYFYETVTQADLMQPQYQLRQAEVYIHSGDSGRAKILLENLIVQGQWREQAESLLASMDAEIPDDTTEENTWAEAISLQRRGNHYRVSLGIGRSDSVQLLIDTGASVTSISRSRFEKLSRHINFQVMGSRMFNTANGVTKVKVFRAPQLHLGQFTLENIELAVLNFDTGGDFDGLLGMNVLKHFRFEIDQDKSTLYLQKRQ